MQIAVGIDIAKELHWVSALNQHGEVLLDRSVVNDPEALQGLVDKLQTLQGMGQLVVGLDVVGGIASLTQAMLSEAGFRVVHVSGLAVNRARQGTVGGENKSDPRDARVIAREVLFRNDLRALEAEREVDLDIRLLVGRRRDLVTDQTRRIARLHDLLATIHPGLERVLNLKRKTALCLLSRYVTPQEFCDAGEEQLLDHLQQLGAARRAVEMTRTALASAQKQQLSVPGERVAAALIKELANEALAVRARLKELDHELKALLEQHPDAALISSLPGMGVALTAELIAEAGSLKRFRTADALAAAAGLAPVLRQSGRVRFRRRPSGGNKGLKRVFYQSAFCSLSAWESRTFYDRKRREGKRHHQALIALARRRINVLWAMMRSRQPYQPKAAITT